MTKTLFFPFTFILFFLSKPLIAQETLTTDKVDFSKFYVDSPFSLVDNNEQLHLFFMSKSKATHLIYDEKYQLKTANNYNQPPSPFKDLLGYSLNGSSAINLYFSNPKSNRFLVRFIEEGEITIEKEFDFKIKKELFIKAINHQNNFYILTAVKATSILKLYKFDGDQYNIQTYDFSQKRFLDYKNEPIELSKLLKEVSVVPIVEEEVPSAIDITSKIVKIYPKKDHLILTFDHRDSGTRIMRLNLSNGESDFSYHSVATNLFTKASYNLSSNSFLYRNRIYQLIADRYLLVFTIKNLADGELIKEYSFNEDDIDIPIANSPIYQDGSLYSGKVRELDKTKQFLRKTSKSAVGVFAYEKEGLLQVQLGGVSEINTGGGGAVFGAFGGIPIATAGALTVTFNPAFFAYDSFSKTRSVFIKCLFDINTLEHLPGPTENTVFDNVADYADTLERIDLETVFRRDDYFIYGYYHKKNKTYSLLSFEP
jgi:hypothetical protein